MKFKQLNHESQKNWHKETCSAKAKDHLISKRLFGCLQFSQKMNESNSTWSTMVKVRQSRKQIMVSSILQKNKRWDDFQYMKLSQFSFFGRIEDTIIYFRDLLTLKKQIILLIVEWKNSGNITIRNEKLTLFGISTK